jgi:hypothetical protein
MILSLIIAAVIWALVTYATDIDITKTVRVSSVSFSGTEILKNKGYVVLGLDPSSGMFSVELSGKRSRIIEVIDGVTIEADVSQINGEGVFEIEGSVKNPVRQVTVTKTNFRKIPVVVEKYTEKEVPVRVHHEGEYKGKIAKSIPEIKTVTISGAKSEIERVEAAVAFVDLTGMTGQTQTVSTLVPVDSKGEILNEMVTLESAKAQVAVNNTIYNYVELPVKVKLSDQISQLYKLDKEKTKAEPDTVGIGVIDGMDFKEITAVLEEYTDKKTECNLTEEEGMYIPSKSSVVEVKPVFEKSGSETQ